VRLLANPIIMRLGLALFVSIATIAAAILIIRALRRKLVEHESLPDSLGGNNDATFAYSAVIQTLKQQKFELQNENDSQKRRAKSTEQITGAVIANLPCGVLFIGPNGLVKQANAAAKQLLGFASPLGMSPDELFRDSIAIADAGETSSITDEIKNSLRLRTRATLDCTYHTFAGAPRSLSLTLIPLTIDETSGLACVIADETDLAELRREKLLHSEVSAEMALHLRTSLAMIRECSERIGGSDAKAAPALASDITAETDRIDKVVGNFLAQPSAIKAAAARA
jgi:nitrogen fixation/metabolism regulation signal transduction histidine kinase